MLWSLYALGTRTEYNGIMVWPWMLWSPYALGTRTELWLGHGCSGHRMLLEHERNYGQGIDALVTVCSWNTNGIQRNYGLAMDALVTICSWNTNGIMVRAWMLWSLYALGTRTEYNGIMVWPWMLWSPYALGTRTDLWLGHGCSGRRMLFEHERNGCSRDRMHDIMV